jgi:UDP-3-O-[3-hydroxymyristoyl] N-acetylglucosamine deacetylase
VNHGIRFVRTDLGVEVAATTACLGGPQQLQTGLRQGAAAIETVEHLLSALRSLGVDNAIIELNQPEVPIMDGSASPWVYLIQSTGTKDQGAPRKTMEILSPVEVHEGDKRITVFPYDRFKVTYSIAFDHPLLRHQEKSLEITEQVYVDEIAPARTFGFLKDVELMRQRGLALGGSLDNAIVIGETGVLNQLRFDDEFVRHKMLDVIGDLALMGHPIRGHVVVQRGGHALHTKFATELLRQRDAWRLVDASEPAAAPVAARVPARSAVR